MEKPSWLEISLVVDGELAEAVAEVLGRSLPDGVVLESTAIEHTPDTEGRPAGPLRVCGYIPGDENLEATRQKIEEGLWHLGRIQPLPAAVFRPIVEENWMEAWKAHYRPIAVGRRLLVLPAWLPQEDPARVAIKIDPGMAFGTGTHPTTQLCLEILEQLPLEGVQVIDVGCGSGILAVAAVLLGARGALAVDIEAEARAATLENAARNGVREALEVGVGSVELIRGGAFSVREGPVVVANILGPVLVRLLEEGLGELVSPGGVLVLSGILDVQEGAVLAALERHGLRLVSRRGSADWLALVARREGPG